MSCPVHLVIFRLHPAAEACVIKVTTCVIVAVYFVWAIPAVIGEVTELSPWDTRLIPAAVRWTIHVSFYGTYRQDSWKKVQSLEFLKEECWIFSLKMPSNNSGSWKVRTYIRVSLALIVIKSNWKLFTTDSQNIWAKLLEASNVSRSQLTHQMTLWFTFKVADKKVDTRR